MPIHEGDIRSASTVHGRNFACNKSGRGGPSVVIEAGLGAESADWAEVEAAVGKLATVFRCDRSGCGTSDAPTEVRDAVALVTYLRDLLDTEDVPSPCSVVGHSFGGLLAQVFARHHRADVSGLVLVEFMHPDQFEVLGPAFPPLRPGDALPSAGMRRVWTGGWRCPNAAEEKIDLQPALQHAPAAGSLDDPHPARAHDELLPPDPLLADCGSRSAAVALVRLAGSAS